MLSLAKKYLSQFKTKVILGPIFKWIEAVFELIVPLVTAAMIDNGILRSDSGYVLGMGGLMVLLGVTGLCSSLTCQYMASRVSQGVGTALRDDLFSRISSLSAAQLGRIGASSLSNRVINDTNQLQVAAAMLIRLVVRAPFLAVGATVMAFIVDARTALIFLAAAPLIGLILWFVTTRSVPYFKRAAKGLDGIGRVTRENLAGVRVIRAFSAQRRETQRFEEATEDYRDITLRAGRISALLSPGTAVVANLAVAAIIFAGGARVNLGALTTGGVVALVNYMTQIMLAMVVVANLVVIFTRASASAARVNEIFAMEGDIKEGAGAKEDAGAPLVRFENACLSYSPDAGLSLDKLSFEGCRGQTVGIIGPTGSGKSTAGALLTRLYDATAGNVYLSGAPIADYTFARLRNKVVSVPQKATLLSGSLRDALRMGRDIDEARLMRAVTDAQAADFVVKLGGLDAEIEQGGINLSGGQRQRLTVARALAGDPEILLLDDSMSALDFATERALREALAASGKDRLTVIITQRVHSIQSADTIIVLEEGEVRGIGKHEALYESCPQYREICDSQRAKGVTA